jgi:hypothetical protein
MALRALASASLFALALKYSKKFIKIYAIASIIEYKGDDKNN